MASERTRGATKEGGGSRLVNVGIDMNVAPVVSQQCPVPEHLGQRQKKGSEGDVLIKSSRKFLFKNIRKTNGKN